MKLQTYIRIGIVSTTLSVPIIAQAQQDISDNITRFDPHKIKQTMLAYEKSHEATTIDTISRISGEHTIFNKQSEILKTGIFKDGQLIDGEIYKYDSKGMLKEKHIYRLGKFMTKISQ